MKKARALNLSTLNKGFSLLEVLVAFTILSLTLTVVMQIFSQVSFSSSVVTERRHALLLAQTQLDRLAAEKAEVGSHSGQLDENTHWQAHIYTLETVADINSGEAIWNGDSSYLTPYKIELKLSWNKTRELHLTRIYLHGDSL